MAGRVEQVLCDASPVGDLGGRLTCLLGEEEWECLEGGATLTSRREPLDWGVTTGGQETIGCEVCGLNRLTKYQRPEEQAELQLSIGLVYNQRTGIVDPARAVIHLSHALKYNLPERTYIATCTWRGSSYEQLKKYPEALRDYIRGSENTCPSP